MKIKHFKLIILICLSTQMSAQDYQPVNSGRTQLFQSYYQGIQCIRIDSTDFSGDSILFPFAIIIDTADFCFTPYYTSWIGPKVIIEPGGRTLFFNLEGDSITVMHSANLEESWTMYMYPDSSRIQASIIAHDTLSFLGLHDSVKVIGMQYLDKWSEVMDLKLNTMQIRLSKNYGIISIMNFVLFPEILENFLYWEIEVLDLVGMTAPKTGLQNLTWFEVWDFESGDELHILYESWRHDFNDNYFYRTTKENFRYLKRRNYSDSIVYQVARKRSSVNVSNNGSEESYINDTIRTTIKRNDEFDKLPGEPVFRGDYAVTQNYMTTGERISKSISREEFYRTEQTCWEPIILEGFSCGSNYSLGLGGPYHYCDEGFYFGGSERKIVYYKKGETTWGSPQIVPTNIDSPSSFNKIQLLPNPATDFVAIKSTRFSTNTPFEIFGIDGRPVMQGEIRSASEEISLHDLGAGMYIVKIGRAAEILIVQ